MAAVCVGVAGAGCREAGQPAAATGEDTERSDAAAIVWARREKEVLDLREQIATLTVSLARHAAEQDRSRFEAEPAEAAEFRLRSTDPELGWVILDAGAGHGVEVGVDYEIYRGERWVARVRTADVRERVAGAWVQEVKTGWTPEPGDRAVREQRKR